MSTCRTCTHWREHDREWGKPESGGSGWGRCDLIHRAQTYTRAPTSRRAQISTAHGGFPSLTTAADFGCVEHEAKP